LTPESTRRTSRRFVYPRPSIPVDYNHVDFSEVGGGWIHCGSTPSS